jgi:hypothetical protein
MYHMASSSSLDLYDPEKYVTESGGGRRGGGGGAGDSYSYSHSYSQSFDARDDSPTFLPGPGSAGSNESSLSPAQFNAALGGSSNGSSNAVPAVPVVPAGQAIGASGPAPVVSVKPPLEAAGAATTGSAAPASAGTTTAAAVHPGLKRRKSSIYIQAQASDSINESHPQQLNAYLEV